MLLHVFCHHSILFLLHNVGDLYYPKNKLDEMFQVKIREWKGYICVLTLLSL